MPPPRPRAAGRSRGRRGPPGVPRRRRTGTPTSRDVTSATIFSSEALTPRRAAQRATSVGASRTSHPLWRASAPVTRTRIASPSRMPPSLTWSASDAVLSPVRWPSQARCARPSLCGWASSSAWTSMTAARSSGVTVTRTAASHGSSSDANRSNTRRAVRPASLRHVTSRLRLAVREIELTTVGDDLAPRHVEPLAVDEYVERGPVGEVDELRHGQGMRGEDAVGERRGPVAGIALLEAPTRGEPPVPDGEHRFLRIEPRRLEPVFDEDPGVVVQVVVRGLRQAMAPGRNAGRTVRPWARGHRRCIESCPARAQRSRS